MKPLTERQKIEAALRNRLAVATHVSETTGRTAEKRRIEIALAVLSGNHDGLLGKFEDLIS